MIDARFVPLATWPGEPTRSRKPTPFKASYLDTLDRLETELRHLGAREILIQAFYTREQIRNDGWPKAGAVPSQSGVILSFNSRGKPLSFPCDRYMRVEANVRAIALSLEALRAVDRYGVTRRAEQYQGWAQIAPPTDFSAFFATKDDAARFVSEQAFGDFFTSHAILTDPEMRSRGIREAQKRLHPDNSGTGDRELWLKLQVAKALLETP